MRGIRPSGGNKRAYPLPPNVCLYFLFQHAMKKKTNIFCWGIATLFLLCCLDLSAQKRDVPGTVVDESGKPVKDVRICIANTKIVEKTNKKGEFRLKDVLSTDSLIVYLKGNQGAKFLLGDTEQLHLQVKVDALAIEGSGSSVSSVSLETMLFKRYGSGNSVTWQMIERNNYLSIKDAIRAFIPGFSTSGGSASIRGSNTLNLSTEPLVLLDGRETTLAEADQTCNMQDVELIEVIKDGLGYGAKGANGVIIIQTKK